nr:reverse transcriptase domain-containing protein [Tanacetum cinerariifolium]
MPSDCLKIIESKSKVRQSRAKAVVAKVNSSSSTPAISSDIAELKDMVRALLLDKKNQSLAPATSPTPAPVKAVESNCVTCSGTHSYQTVPLPAGTFIKTTSKRSVTLPGKTVTNPKEDLKGITTRSGVAYKGPTIPTPSKVVKYGTKVTKDQLQTPSSQSTSHVQPLVTQSENSVSEPIAAPVSAPMPNLKPSIPYPSRRDNERRPLIGNKEKLSEMARTLMNEHCSTVILNKLPNKLGDPDKFLIPCEFSGMDECLALADLGASINLMPLSMWKELALPELTPTCMTLELADRSVSKPIGIAKDVSVKTGRALIDVHKGELTLQIGNEAITYNLDQTSRYSANYDQMTANKIDVTDEACEEYFQEVLDFSDVTATKTIKSSVDEPPEVELKDLPPHLEYAFLEGNNKFPVIIAKDPWVSPVHCVPKKGGFTILKNEENDLIPTRLVTGWQLNQATRKDHFPLPFMDQMLERLAGNEYYCFLDGFSGYFQIPIDPRDQEKTTFNCPYGTFAYRRMPFGLCNAPGTFQRCMLAIFQDMVEKTMEVFMDDFSVFGNSFETCLYRLDKMLQRCEDTKLCLNWEKSHFMVKEG